MKLAQNPFFILEATPRDGRQRILELAEEKALFMDEALVREAASTLTNPGKRISAETAWFPGLDPERISEVLSLLETNPVELRRQTGLSSLAQANLLAEGLLRVVEKLDGDEVVKWVLELGDVNEDLDASSTVGLINEDRMVAGFPEIADKEDAKSKLRDRRQHYRRSIRDALDRLSPANLVSVATKVVERATNNGNAQAPLLIDEFVDGFEGEAKAFLEQEAENVFSLIERLRATVEAGQDEAKVNSLVVALEKVVRNWDTVAQPIQLSSRSRGRDHDFSNKVAGEIRGLAVELFNEHDLLDVSKRLTNLQQEVFAEVDRVVEQSEEDASALDEIAEQRSKFLEETEAQAESWRQEITFEADLGKLVTKKLRISPEGIEWKGKQIPLEEVTRVRWGATKHSVNFVPTGTTYYIFYGTQSQGVDIELGQEWIFTKFIDCLWRAVGVRLLTEMLQGLRDGERYQFGSAVVSDIGVELERRKVLAGKERVTCEWVDLVIGNGPGTFYIAKQDERNVSADLPYQVLDNVHVLETAMRVFWKRPSARLSDLLSPGAAR